jgi:hypothetical protein
VKDPPLVNCQVSAFKSEDTFLVQLNANGMSLTNEAQSLLSISMTLQSKIYLSLLAAAGSFFLLSVLFLSGHKWSTKRSSATVSTGKSSKFYHQQMMRSVWLSVSLIVASTISITQISAALQYWNSNIPNSSITIKQGTTLQILQWTTAAMSFLFALGVSAQIGSPARSLPGPGGFRGPMVGPMAGPMAGPAARLVGRPMAGAAAAPSRAGMQSAFDN